MYIFFIFLHQTNTKTHQIERAEWSCLQRNWKLKTYDLVSYEFEALTAITFRKSSNEWGSLVAKLYDGHENGDDAEWQLTITFSAPNCSFVAAINELTSLSELRSVGTNSALLPMAVATAAPFDVLASHRTTRAPFAMKCSAVALPMPDEAPVTNATKC